MAKTRTIVFGVLFGIAAAGCGSSHRSSHPGSAGGAATRQSRADTSAPLAVVGDETITVADLQDRLQKQSPYIRARYTSLPQKERFLDNMIRFDVLAQEAKKEGFDKNPEVVRAMKQMMVEKLMEHELANGIKPQDITDAEMRAFYKKHENEFHKPEQVRVSAIILDDKHRAAKVARLALGAKGATSAGFRALVDKYSTDKLTQQRGGDLRYFSRGSKAVPAPVIKAAFALDSIGAVAGPIAANGRYYIIKRTGHRDAVTRTYDEVRRQIQNRIYQHKRAEGEKKFIADLKRQANIKIFKKNLAKVQVSPGSPPTTGSVRTPMPAVAPRRAGNATPHP